MRPADYHPTTTPHSIVECILYSLADRTQGEKFTAFSPETHDLRIPPVTNCGLLTVNELTLTKNETDGIT
jgi:hypothetical protein